MKKILSIILSLAMILSTIIIPSAFIVSADEVTTLNLTYYVDANVESSGDGLSAGTAFKTIAEAVAAAAAQENDTTVANAIVYVAGTADFGETVAHKGMITIDGQSTGKLNGDSYVWCEGLTEVLAIKGPTTIQNIALSNVGSFATYGHELNFKNVDSTATTNQDLYVGNNYRNGRGGDKLVVDGMSFAYGKGAKIHLTPVANNPANKTGGNTEVIFNNGSFMRLNIKEGIYEGLVSFTFNGLSKPAYYQGAFLEGAPTFNDGLQFIFNNGLSKTNFIGDTFDTLEASKGVWFISSTTDGALSATETAGKFAVEGDLIAVAKDAVGNVVAKSEDGVLNLSEDPGTYNVTYELPAVDTVYVSSTGSDENNGLTADTAFATIDKAIQRLNNADGTIYVSGTVEYKPAVAHMGMITIDGQGSATINMTSNVNLAGVLVFDSKGPTTFQNITLAKGDIIATNGNELVFGKNVVVLPVSNKHQDIFVGNNYQDGTGGDKLIIDSFSMAYGFGAKVTLFPFAKDSANKKGGKTDVVINGGPITKLGIEEGIYEGLVSFTFNGGTKPPYSQASTLNTAAKFNDGVQFIFNNGLSKDTFMGTAFDTLEAAKGVWFMYSDASGGSLRTTETAGKFTVEGGLIANAYKVVNGEEVLKPVKSVNGILDLSGEENAGIYNVKYATRVEEANNDSVVYVSNTGNDLSDGKSAETAFGSLEFALKWLAESTAENKKIIISGEHNFVNVAYDDMVTITSENGTATINSNNIKAGGPVTFDNIVLLGWLYSNGNEVVFNKNCSLSSSSRSGFIIGSDSAEKIDKVVINGSGLYGFAGSVRIGASTNVASYGLDLTVGGGTFSQFIFSDWAAGGTHYGDVNITFNGAIGGDCGGKILYNTTQVFDGALQFILNGVSPTTIDDKVYSITAKDGEWFMFGERTAKLATTEVEGKFTVSGAKYAKAVSVENQSVYYSENGVLTVPQGSYNVTYFNSFKKGDANGDGDIDIRDLIGIKEAIANLNPFDLMVDLDGDNNNSASDIIKLRKHLLRIDKIVWDDTLNYLSNTYTKLVEDKKLNVAFMGGSVTDGFGSTGEKNNGWPTLICDWLAKKYGAEITENRQSIGGTGSYFGAFRYSEDIKTVPDLFFIEFAINDRYEGYTYEETVKYSETLVRNALEMNPNMDIIYVLTFDRDSQVKTADYETLRAHRDVANKYGFLCIKIADEFYQIMDENGTKDYDFIPDGVHPNDDGYEIYSQIIIDGILSDLPANKTETNEITAKVLPDAMSDYYENPHMLLAKDLEILSTDGWYIDTKGNKFIELRYGGSVKSSTVGSKFSFEFDGKDFGILYHAESYIGSISVSIDGEEPIVFSGYYHNPNPKTKFIIDDLQEGKHTVEITLLDGSFIIPAFFIN